VWVSIEDSGPGIPPEYLPKLFSPNFTTKTVGANYGLGLGLAISFEIVQKHGGRLEASNRPEGGAKFTVVLPTAGMT
jgi:two-component system sensor histidine kinase HupT/HoxJ